MLINCVADGGRLADLTVATSLAGIRGMNFEFMPEPTMRWGYPAAPGLIAGACALMWWRFRRLRWL